MDVKMNMKEIPMDQIFDLTRDTTREDPKTIEDLQQQIKEWHEKKKGVNNE